MRNLEQLRDEVKKVMDDVVKWRRHFHENPELGFDLDETVQYVSDVLDELEIPHITNKEKAYVIAHINKGKEGQTIAVRADMDALPVQEASGLEFSSKVEGKMHACGHDGHMACLLGLAKFIQGMKDELNGSVKFIFQPAEELGLGSQVVIEDGHIDDVDQILGMHNGCLYEFANPGELVFSPGSMMATMDKFSLKVIGKGAHGSTPQLSRDPITIASYIILGLQEIISREVDPRDPAVISVGTIDAGKVFNVIPETCFMEGTTRVFTNEVRDLVERRIGEVAENIAKSFGAEVEYKFYRQPPPLVNDQEVAEKLIAISEAMYPDATTIMKKPSMPGEDFAWYLQKVKGSFFFLHNPLEIDGKVWPHHNGKFAIDEQYFDRPIAVMAGFIVEELGK